MSDTSQGEGWWLASDGKWYPPQSTVAVADPPPPPGVPPAPVAQPPAKPTKKIYKRVWFWILMAVVVLFGGCIALVAGGTKTPSTIGGTNKSTATTVQPKTSTTAPVVGPAEISTTMTGTAKPTIPAGTAGKAQVVVTGPFVTTGGGTKVPVVVVNELGHTVNHLDVAGPASVNGQVVGSGDSQGFAPENVQNGQATFGYVYFSTAIPTGATLDLSVTGTAGQSTYFVDMQVVQANLVPPSDTYSPIVVTGTVKNTSDGAVHGPISVDVYCFDSSGGLVNTQGGFTSGDSSAPLEAGATASYSVDLYNAPNCTTYLVGSSGYGKL